MATQIDGMKITHIRRDTLTVHFIFYDSSANNQPYQMQDGDTAVFTMRETFDSEVLLQKTLIPAIRNNDGVPAANLIIPGNEMNFEAGNYVYDVQLTLANGTVSSIKGKIKIVEDITYS